MDINKSTLKDFRIDFSKAIAELEKKHCVRIKLGNICFDDSEFTSKMTVKNNIPFAKDIENHEQQDFINDCFKVSLKPEDYGTLFSLHNGTYKLIGLKPKARKNKLIIENTLNSKKYVISRFVYEDAPRIK